MSKIIYLGGREQGKHISYEEWKKIEKIVSDKMISPVINKTMSDELVRLLTQKGEFKNE